MKESHLFYTPDLPDGTLELPAEEAGHAIRVLRMREGDTLTLTDGLGTFSEARITLASAKHCRFEVVRQWNDRKLWQRGIHLAVAPTKNMDRMEWLTEKATEIGMDRLTLLHCDNSERHIVKTERLEKIAVSVMKQSHKAFKPAIDPLTAFSDFIHQPFDGQKFIAHCHEGEKVPLQTAIRGDEDNLVLIGPEGDFSPEEVAEAVKQGFVPVTLGRSRLRTETAALVAVYLMNLTHTSE